MFCQNCGKEINDASTVCSNCGAAVINNTSAYQQGGQQNYQQFSQQGYQQPYNTEADVPSVVLKVLCFFIPIVGLILFLTKKEQTPISAKSYGKMALIGFIISIVFSTVFEIIGMTLLKSF